MLIHDSFSIDPEEKHESSSDIDFESSTYRFLRCFVADAVQSKDYSLYMF